ncbi:MAG: ABC transporter ATP-binding protein [Armatimonadota bacterium]
MLKQPLLTIKDLCVQFPTDDGLVIAVDGLSLTLGRGRVVGLVGESGCGKTVTGFSILGLLQTPGRIVGGSILYTPDGDEVDLASIRPTSERMRGIRGKEIAMIFQEPMSSLTPVYTVGDQIIEAIRAHEQVTKNAAEDRAIELLKKVGIPAARDQADSYPHQLSGGMRQRVMIAMALSCSPRLLIADEPTTALDVTVQAQIMDLLRARREESGLSILMITHDLGIIADIADDVVVMYAGVAVEHASVSDLFAAPQHPYTCGLLSSIPGVGHERGGKLFAIEGSVPDWRNRPVGCLFAPRCPERFDKCAQRPSLAQVSDGHTVACWARTTAKEDDCAV